MGKFLKYATSLALISAMATTPIFGQTSAPKFEIITPAESQTVYGNKIPVLFTVENFQLVDYQQNPKPAAGLGHIHIWLDDTNHTAQSAIKVTQDTYTFSDVAYGDHTLRAELVASDHKSLSPQQVVTAKFKNEPVPAPAESTTTTGFDKKTATVILVVVALVIIAAWWYTKDEDEELIKTGTKKSSRAKKRK